MGNYTVDVRIIVSKYRTYPNFFLFLSFLISSNLSQCFFIFQEIDLATGTISSILNGTRKLLSKSNPIYALEVRDGLIYSASTSLDGAAVKVLNST